MRKITIFFTTTALLLTQLLAINLLTPANAAEPRSAITLTLLHNNDGESSLGADAIYKTTAGDLRVGSTAAFASVGEITTEGTRVKSITLSDGRALVTAGAPVAGAPNVTIVTNNFTADGGDNYPTLAALKKSAFGIDYEVALYDYLRSFPSSSAGLPTIPDTDARYKALTGEGRITWE
jgi:hypothetical protein